MLRLLRVAAARGAAGPNRNRPPSRMAQSSGLDGRRAGVRRAGRRYGRAGPLRRLPSGGPSVLGCSAPPALDAICGRVFSRPSSQGRRTARRAVRARHAAPARERTPAASVTGRAPAVVTVLTATRLTRLAAPVGRRRRRPVPYPRGGNHRPPGPPDLQLPGARAPASPHGGGSIILPVGGGEASAGAESLSFRLGARGRGRAPSPTAPRRARAPEPLSRPQCPFRVPSPLSLPSRVP